MVQRVEIAGGAFVLFGLLLTVGVLLYQRTRSYAGHGLGLLGAGFLLRGLEQLTTPAQSATLPPLAAFFDLLAHVAAGVGLGFLAFEGLRLYLLLRHRIRWDAGPGPFPALLRLLRGRPAPPAVAPPPPAAPEDPAEPRTARFLERPQ